MSVCYRSKVLVMYKKIIKAGLQWEGAQKESTYIIQEAHYLFRKNKDIVNNQMISDKLNEAEARYELALHYQIPYPRPYHNPPRSIPAETQDAGVWSHARGTYLHSYYDDHYNVKDKYENHEEYSIYKDGNVLDSAELGNKPPEEDDDDIFK
eukprot:TRINITY_DN15952_c0_g1_i1.p1 TRINITY_DN15952_c0_g1~~TRINITY_DN15952_c0_g1_i1.p1  ORF type:complete len:152 (-),score=46.90 TRINITY_DN15952_c0_g1_i1:76-531(-)